MQTASLNPSVVWFCRAAARVAGVFAIAVGVVGLLGWVLDVETLKSAFTGPVTIKANAAMCLILLGGALLLLAPQEPQGRLPGAAAGARAMAAVALSVAGLTFLQHVGGFDFGIDQLLFREVPGAVATASPGRMGPPASLSFVLAGLALLLLNVRTPRGGVPSQWLALLVGLIALFPLIGYAYRIQPLYGIARYTGIALHTAIAIAVLSAGLLAVRPTEGWMRVVCADDAGGVTARRLLLPAILLPLALGWLRTVGERAGLFDAAFGRALMVVSMIVIFTALVLLNARDISRLGRQSARAERERRLGEEELHASRERYRNFISLSSEGIWRFELDSPIPTSLPVDEQVDLIFRHAYLAECNDAMARMYGYDSAAEITGWRLDRFQDPADLRSREFLKAFIAGGYRLQDGESHETSRDGAVRVFLNSFVGTVEDGKVLRAWGTQRDVTDRKRVEQEREALLEREQAARAEAERASRMKDDFLATLSHELRTPLNAILGWAHLLAQGGGRGRGTDPAELAEGLRTIERNARAQTQIIEDLLDMSRIVSGKVRLDVRPVDPQAVVEAALETVRPAAEAKDIRLHKVLDPEAGTVSGDPNRLQQVFWNLLSNAVKFTPRGGRVQVLLRRVEGQVEVSVVDDGEGIREDFLPHVFDRFRQADGSTTRRHGGLGLGLAIVRQLIELHGGTVRAESDGPGRGARFTVALPVATASAAPHARPSAGTGADVGVGAGEGAAPPGDAGGGDGPSLRGVRVLVVDDEADSRALVRRVLEDRGATVAVAGSADEAMEQFGRGPPDVLLSDIGMPGEDGYGLVRRVRALGPGRGGDVPAVALTAYARLEDRLRAMQHGFQMHAAKPIEPAELVLIVATLAGRTGRAATG